VLASGRLIHDERVIDIAKINHTQRKQTAIQRYFNTKSLSIFTAGMTSTDLVIDDINEADIAFLGLVEASNENH
jgi:membrane protein YdbS with pleckstrin-like domain